jgi:nucleotide-binding universal stress UspA family protein
MRFMVALDQSEKDAAVAAPTVQLAQAARAEVVLVNVVSPWVDTAVSKAPTPDERLREVITARHAYLEQAAVAFAPAPVSVLVEQLQWPPGQRSEEVAAGIARVARAREVDILVVASKRASGVTGLLLGSTAGALLRLSPCPVLIVRPE